MGNLASSCQGRAQMHMHDGLTRSIGKSSYACLAAITGALAVLLLAGVGPASAERPNIMWMAGGDSTVNSVAYSPDGQMLASGSTDYTVKLWRLADGVLLRDAEWAHLGGAFGCFFQRTVGTLASGGGYPDNTVKLWRASDGALLRTLTGHTSYVYSVAFSPDGQTVVSGRHGPNR